MIIRKGNMKDLEKIVEVESLCFPPSEAATKETLKQRLNVYANHFWLLWEDNVLVSFIDGMTTNEKDLKDKMYEDTSMHDEHGDWQMIFGVNTIPTFQHQGYASHLMNHVIVETRKEGKKGLVLTCKEKLIPFYEQFGFIDEGISESVHGNVVWYQMRLLFEGDINDKKEDK
ncbi:MAG: GNAT family N-acetyltransferase [Bacilli bacterium]|nr:GNAT family N-acetyltransferase [Bacilli bacterium]